MIINNNINLDIPFKIFCFFNSLQYVTIIIGVYVTCLIMR